MEQVRAFVAIELSEEIKTSLARLQSGLRAESYVKWVEPAGIHLTLKFLGNVASDRVSEVEQSMAQACAGVPSFALRIEQLGAFPSVSSPRVVWVGGGGEVGRCVTLKRRIDEEFIPLGYSVEA